ncbi:hypothetical protein LZK98_19965 [Sphingomonas cannabina]|uniref:hypothetical protein n=1 Tax=Sphingomonas cannabina TaxID=2899123 RepID=UPI001F1DFE6E|nr:hypothetical protein [Sphingomonas cannabina]UIJ45287.1 hypothetical protein LZK98_19965 [Sphingomonas cannabina]
MVTILRGSIQLAIVALLAAATVFVVDWTGIRSAWLLLWIIGMPAVTAKLFDREGEWPLTALWLVICAVVVMSLDAASFGLLY